MGLGNCVTAGVWVDVVTSGVTSADVGGDVSTSGLTSAGMLVRVG